MSSEGYRATGSSRTLLLFLSGYALAILVLGVGDAAGLVARAGGDHGLTWLELALLSIFSLSLAPKVYLGLLAGGTAYLAALSLVPPRWTRARIALLCLPLGLLASATARAAKQLPLFMRMPLLELSTWVAAIAAPPVLIGIGLYLAREDDAPGWTRRAGLAGLALALALFIRVFGLTEAVMARIPGTLLSLVALTCFAGYALRGVRRPLRVAVALLLAMGLGMAYTATMPPARSVRARAVVAHKTQLLQALLFTEMALFERPSVPARCDASPPAVAEPNLATRAHNLLVITLDALRADHLASYGYDRVTMPHVETLFRDSIVFDTAYSAAPATAGSLTALWTGSSAYTMREAGSWPRTLQERLRDLGYRVVGTDLSAIARKTAPGFPSTPLWDAPVDTKLRAGPMVDAVIERIAATEGPFLAFIHFMETHDTGAYRYVPRVFPERPWSRYDDAMFEVDRHLGRLFTALRASHRYEDTVIVFTSDHGEFFGEHARMHHGSLLYEPVVRVPFALKLPGVPPRREATFVSGFDLAPTAYRAATGRAWPTFTIGRDVLGEIESDRGDRAVYMENVSGRRGVRRVVAVRKGRFKYTRLQGTGVEELFDLERDPGELENLAGEAPDTLHAMRAELEAALRARGCELRALRNATSRARGH